MYDFSVYSSLSLSLLCSLAHSVTHFTMRREKIVYPCVEMSVECVTCWNMKQMKSRAIYNIIYLFIVAFVCTLCILFSHSHVHTSFTNRNRSFMCNFFFWFWFFYCYDGLIGWLTNFGCVTLGFSKCGTNINSSNIHTHSHTIDVSNDTVLF